MNGRYEVGDIVLGKWTLTRLIGAGSYGKVFEARRKDFGGEYDAAIKIIVIPQTQEEVSEVLSEGMTEESASEYFRSFVEEISKEFALMSKLKGDSNIVSYEDHEVVPHTDGIGWDIIIRMELLTPFSAILKTEALTREDIINLGIDICRALELCQEEKIIHRDIKPDNIFRSKTGHYKLGDFGVARTIDKTTGGLSKKGTYNYMAPEVYREEPYGASVDIYSLGIVLYRLLNDNRIPFLPPVSQVIRHADREAALARRMSGEQIPYPANDKGRLAEIALKACAYDPKNRYPDPRAMREDLEALLEEEKEVFHPAEEDATVYNGVRNFHRSAGTDSSTGSASSAKPVPEKQPEPAEKLAEKPAATSEEKPKADPKPEIVSEPTHKPSGIKKAIAIIGILAVLLAAGLGIFAYINGQRNKPQEPKFSPLPVPAASATPIPTSASTAVAPTATPIPTPTTTPTPTPTPEPTVSPTPVPTATPTPKPTVTPTSTLKPIPEILSVELDENNNPVLSWQPMENANLYYIYQTEDYGADKQLVTTKNTNYTIKSCKVGHKYGFRIKARFLDGTYSLLSEYEYINYAEISSIKLHKENLSLEAYLVVRVGTPVTLTAEAYGEENNGNVPLSNAKFEWKLADSNIQSIRVGSKDNSQCTIEALTPHPEGVDIIVSCNGYEKVLTVYSFESLNEDYSKIQLEETNIRFLNSDLEEAIRKYLGKSSDEALHTMDLKAVSSVKLQGESIVVNEEYYGDAVYKIGPAHENAEGPYGDNWLPFYMSDLARLPNLFYAEIAGRTLYESVTLSQCDKLQRLDIAFCAGVDVDVCTRCKALTELYIHCCRGIIINDVNKDSRINKIQLSRCDYDFLDGFNRLSFIKTLNTLYISTYFNPEKGSHRIYHTTLSFIEPFVQIKDLWVADALYLNNCAILGKLTALEHLHLDDFGAMTLYLKNKATGYEALSNLTQLKELDVGGAAYLNNLSFASEMTKLEKLDIRGTDISDLSPIAELPLKELKVSSPLLDSAKSLFPNANVIAVD